MSKIWVLAVLLGLIIMPRVHAQQPAEGYRFSPVNQYGISLTASYWNPIIRYVSEKSGVKLSLKIGRTSADTTTYVLAEEVEFVFTNHLFSPEREKLGWKVFGRRKTPPVRGEIIVPADSPVKSLAELDGAPVGFPGPEATIAYKFTFGELIKRKVNAQPVFAGNMDAALVQLFSGKVRAAGVNSQLAEGYAKREGKTYRVLWASEPLHDLALMASTKVPAGEVAAVGRAFFGMDRDPEGRAVLKAAAAAVAQTEEVVFIPSNGSEYGPYRNFYKSAPASLQ